MRSAGGTTGAAQVLGGEFVAGGVAFVARGADGLAGSLASAFEARARGEERGTRALGEAFDLAGGFVGEELPGRDVADAGGNGGSEEGAE